MTRYQLTDLTVDRVGEASRLFAAGYRDARERQPVLPGRYDDPATTEPLLRRMVEKRPGVAAVRDGRIVGYLAGGVIPDWRGDRTAFVPFWGHAVSVAERGRFFEDLYVELSARWAADGCTAYLITVLVHDGELIETLFRLGHGIAVVDALRGLTPVPGQSAATTVRRAGSRDQATWRRLHQGLVEHLAGAPVFMPAGEPKSDDYFDRWLTEPGHAVWLAEQDGAPVGYMQVCRLDEEVVVTDERTAGIQGAFTVPELRGQGIGTALLNRCLGWAREQGFERCAVDFEGENVLGRRFWLGCFEPGAYSVVRRLDRRRAAKAPGGAGQAGPDKP